MSSKSHSIFRSNRCCLIITGASKGFGRILAKKFANQFSDQFTDDKESIIKFILIARNVNEIDSLANKLRSIDSRINISKIITDLAETKAIDDISQEFERNQNNLSRPYDHYILIHNAGSIGKATELCKTVNVNDADKRNAYYRLNLYSVMEMTGIFLRHIETKPNVSHCHIINVSSLAAIQPMSGMLDYCVGKAAREAYFKQLSNELTANNDSKRTKTKYRLLNYAPGPLDTEMFRQLQQESTLQEQFREIIPLKPEDSADKLFQILHEDKFANAAHVDYYD